MLTDKQIRARMNAAKEHLLEVGEACELAHRGLEEVLRLREELAAWMDSYDGAVEDCDGLRVKYDRLREAAQGFLNAIWVDDHDTAALAAQDVLAIALAEEGHDG